MERIKLQIEILKIKLTFFTGLSGGISYLFLNIYKLHIFNAYILYVIFVLLFLYGLVGVLLNISFLNDKYKELATWR
ncbi:hypothetical protein [Sulfurimonas sp.]